MKLKPHSSVNIDVGDYIRIMCNKMSFYFARFKIPSQIIIVFLFSEHDIGKDLACLLANLDTGDKVHMLSNILTKAENLQEFAETKLLNLHHNLNVQRDKLVSVKCINSLHFIAVLSKVLANLYK